MTLSNLKVGTRLASGFALLLAASQAIAEQTQALARMVAHFKSGAQAAHVMMEDRNGPLPPLRIVR